MRVPIKIKRAIKCLSNWGHEAAHTHLAFQYVLEHNDCTQKDVVSNTGIRQSTISLALMRLAEMGYIDARYEGRERRYRVSKHHESLHGKIQKAIGDKDATVGDLKHFLSLVEQFRDLLRTMTSKNGWALVAAAPAVETVTISKVAQETGIHYTSLSVAKSALTKAGVFLGGAKVGKTKPIILNREQFEIIEATAWEVLVHADKHK